MGQITDYKGFFPNSPELEKIFTPGFLLDSNTLIIGGNRIRLRKQKPTYNELVNYIKRKYENKSPPEKPGFWLTRKQLDKLIF